MSDYGVALLVQGALRLAAIAASVVCFVLGYKLFMRGVTSGGAGADVSAWNMRLVIGRGGPGLLFALFGVLLVAIAFLTGGVKSDSEMTESRSVSKAKRAEPTIDSRGEPAAPVSSTNPAGPAPVSSTTSAEPAPISSVKRAGSPDVPLRELLRATGDARSPAAKVLEPEWTEESVTTTTRSTDLAGGDLRVHNGDLRSLDTPHGSSPSSTAARP